MRSFLTLGLLGCAVAAAFLIADDRKPDGPQVTAPSPADVSVSSRANTQKPVPETVLDKRANIRIDTTLVLIPVSVTDPMSRFVTGLEKENFKIYEDKVEQEIVQFSSEDAPLSVGVVFDTSGSMGDKLKKSRQAVKQFMKTANPEDEFFLIQFNDRPEMSVAVHSRHRRDSEPADVHRVQGTHRAARWRLHGDESDEEGSQPAQGDPDHLRRWG